MCENYNICTILYPEPGDGIPYSGFSEYFNEIENWGWPEECVCLYVCMCVYMCVCVPGIFLEVIVWE